MHLKMTFTAPDGTTYVDGFVKLTAVTSIPETSTLCLNFYPDAAAYEAGDVPVDQRAEIRPTADLTVPLFDESYLYLITLPEYSGAVIVADPAPVDSIDPVTIQ